MRRRIIWGLILVAVALVAGLLVATARLFRPESINALVSRKLAEHLNLDAHVDDIHVTWLPRPRVTGSGLTLRIPGRPDLPPFVRIAHFYADIGLLSAARRHVDTLHVDGLQIAVPPGKARDGLQDLPDTTPDDALTRSVFSDIVVDHLVTHDAQLIFVPREPDATPLTFDIHTLEMSTVGFDRPLPYDAELTNPVPRGLVDAHGTFGPWNKDDPDATPLRGEYTFRHADLSTINGIGGTLTSTGRFTGRMTAIAVTGQADVPDFSLDLGGPPVALTSTFTATVNGTDGSTRLDRVEAKILNTSISASGAITNLAGPGRHDVAIETHVADGRIEDLLAMVLDTPKPVMIGSVHADATLQLPPGEARVRNRIRVTGRFGLARTTFTNESVRSKLEELSRRSQGKDEDDPLGRVLTNLSGRLVLENGTARLTGMRFQVPGATIALDGTYRLATGAMDFRGTLAMQASVSKAVGGFKSIFIRPFDRLFRKDGAGAVLPIRISGTRAAPKYAVEVGRIFGGGNDRAKADAGKDGTKEAAKADPAGAR
jgi:hypothetical protein